MSCRLSSVHCVFEAVCGQDVAVPSSSVELDGNWLMALEREILNERTPQVQAVSLIIPLLLWPFYGGTRFVHALAAFSVWKIHLQTY